MSLKMSPQPKQLKTTKMNNNSKFSRTCKLTELIYNNFGIIREEKIYIVQCLEKLCASYSVLKKRPDCLDFDL